MILRKVAQIEPHHTPGGMSMEDGDIIDVRTPQQHTRGACPLPPQQTLPNIHYLAQPTSAEAEAPDAEVQTTSELATAPKRVKVNIEDTGGMKMEVTMKVNTKFKELIRTYAGKKEVDPKCIRFFFDGERVNEGDTPEKVG